MMLRCGLGSGMDEYVNVCEIIVNMAICAWFAECASIVELQLISENVHAKFAVGEVIVGT